MIPSKLATFWILQVSSSCFCSFRAFLLLLLRRPNANSSDHSISSWGGSLATGRAGHCLLRFQLVGLIRISLDGFKGESTGTPYHWWEKAWFPLDVSFNQLKKSDDIIL
jgi:hypothetical protein